MGAVEGTSFLVKPSQLKPHDAKRHTKNAKAYASSARAASREFAPGSFLLPGVRIAWSMKRPACILHSWYSITHACTIIGCAHPFSI